MSDQIEQIVTALTGCCAECADRAEHIAWAIHEHAPAGLLATPERLKAAQIDYLSGKYPEFIRRHDAGVAARALREAADKLNRDRRTHDASCGESPARTKEQAGRDHGVTIGLRQAVRHLDERAAAIEAGESGADA